VPILHAIVLGLVQGLSEFLPISSSGHLLIVPWWFGWNDLEDPSIKKAFDVALHLGTLVAVVGYFRRDIALFVREGYSAAVYRDRPVTQHGRMAWLLLLSSLPAAAAGALFESWIDTRLGTPVIIAISLIVFGLLLGWADRLAGSKGLDGFHSSQALLIGAAQVLALNPGTSRSGITITASRALGFSRDSAARISFLMSLPVTGGAIVYKVGGLVVDGIPEGLLAPMIAGVVTSAAAGWFAVWGTIRLVRTRSFQPFVIYRIGLGFLILVVAAAGWR
jgi:undecaprenyl-diphosphatase